MPLHTKDEILVRIEELQGVSPEGTDDLFAELRAAVDAFFVGGSGLGEAVKETIQHLSMDIYERQTRYEHQELLPPFPTPYPAGYEDVTVLFDAAGAWDDILTIDINTFPDTFIEVPAEGGEEGGDSGGGGESGMTWENPTMEDWTARITAAKDSSVDKVIALGEWCGNSTGNYCIAQIFEDLGVRTNVPSQTELADRVYISGGFKAVIDMFHLDVHVPSYLK